MKINKYLILIGSILLIASILVAIHPPKKEVVKKEGGRKHSFPIDIKVDPKGGKRSFVIDGKNYQYVEELWQGEWHQLNEYIFYRFHESFIDIIQYGMGNEEMLIREVHRNINLSGLEYVDKTEGDHFLHFKNIDNKDVYVSLYDLINFDHDSNFSIESLCSYSLPEGERTHESRLHKNLWDWNPVSIKVPIIKDFRRNPDVPNYILHTLYKMDIFQGDYGSSTTFRNINGKWFVIVDREFYRYDGNKFTKLGNLPITIERIIGEGVSGVGSQDFTFYQDHWFVADSVGDKIIKLDQDLKLKNIYSISLPYEINIVNDEVKVHGISGVTRLDLDLNLLEENINTTTNIDFAELLPREIDEDSYYQDVKTQLEWFYEDGYLYQFHPSKGSLRKQFVGYLHNAYGKVRIIPQQEKVLVLFDTQLIIYNSDGSFKNRVVFPKGNRNAVYILTTSGENSYYLDKAENKLYLVRGYQILEVNLNSEEVTVLFNQDDSDLGLLHFNKGKLYFTLQPYQHIKYGENYNPTKDDFLSELIIYDLSNNQLKRYLLQGHFQVDSISDEQLILWRAEKEQYKEQQYYMEGTLLKYNLKEFEETHQ